MRKLTVASQSVTYKDSKTILTRFHPSELLPNTKHYVTYEGSLTYPGCYETVTWIVMNNPIYITREDVSFVLKCFHGGTSLNMFVSHNEKFLLKQSFSPHFFQLSIWNDLQQTEIKQSNPVFMSPNYRPLKPLNNRLIRTNINIKYTSRNPGSCPSNIYLNNGYRSNPLKIKHLQKPPAGSRHARRSTSTSSEGEDENNDAYDQAYTLSQFEIETSDNNNNNNDRIDF